MPCELEHKNGHLTISGELTIYAANDAKDRLIEAIRVHGCVRLDLSGVTEIDTSGLQLLLLARRACAATGKSFNFIKPSAAVRETLQLCGLAELVAESVVEGDAP